MTQWEAYLCGFYYLDQLWHETQEDILANTVGNMNPFFWGDGKPADPAVWGDWLKSGALVTDSEEYTEKDAFSAMVAFLKYNEAVFEDDFSCVWRRENIMQEEGWKQSVKHALNPDAQYNERYRLKIVKKTEEPPDGPQVQQNKLLARIKKALRLLGLS